MAEQSETENGDGAGVWGSAYPPSINAGIPKLGELPAGWSRLRMKDLLDVIERPVKLVDSKSYQLVTAKRSRGGIVSRGTLRGDEIKVKQQFEVRSGDFILSNRQIAHGGCGIVPPELDGAVVSGEYTVLHPKPMLDLRFLHYLSHSAYFQQICFHSGVGVHVEKLVFRLHDWLNWQIDIPPLREQQRIAEMLADFDSAIEATDALSKAKQDRKRALIDATFPQLPQSRGYRKVRFKRLGEFVRGVTYNPNGDLCAEGTGVGICGATQIQDGRLLSDGKLVWVNPQVVADKQRLQSGDFAIATSNGSKALVGKAAEIKAVDRPLAVGGFSALLRPKGDTERQLARHLFQSSRYKRFLHIQLSGSSIGNLYTSALEEAEFDVPLAKLEPSLCLLDELGEEIELLTDKSNTLRQQQRGLMQKLLSGDPKHRCLTKEEVAV
ncbi:MAG: restriction endonuclease subunit S [Sphingomonadaceae bacterium]|nr:restriction endonuclease subunit S [Altererythrobacter sp.]MCP5392599.1 restriction endonuclease subunit S [Sphingomonadaceae bacterium]